MIELGFDIKLEEWENLDKLEERIKAGERIYCVKLSQGGDSHGKDNIYGLNGWNTPFAEKATVEVLHSENC